MTSFRYRRSLRAAAVLVALSLGATACGDSDEETSDTTVAEAEATTTAAPADDDMADDDMADDDMADDDMADDDMADDDMADDDMAEHSLSGTLVGAGASSQAAAMQGWQAGFQTLNPEVTVDYDPIGSGGGREQFLTGGSNFAGSDRALNAEEIAQSVEVCASEEGAVNLPHYISPIAVAYNLPGIESLNLTTEALALIFTDQVTNWQDPVIADANPGVELPDLAINPVHRSDESGTTANFTDYLSAVEPDIWTDGSIEIWPYGGEGAQGTSGVVSAINAGEGSIGYADASQIGDLGTAAVQVGEDFVEYSPEAAARIVDVSERVGTGNDFSYNLVRDTTESGVYPIALVSYHIVCMDYADDAVAELVREFMLWVGSEEGQAAAQASAGSAPISPELREQLAAVIETIS